MLIYNIFHAAAQRREHDGRDDELRFPKRCFRPVPRLALAVPGLRVDERDREVLWHSPRGARTRRTSKTARRQDDEDDGDDGARATKVDG